MSEEFKNKLSGLLADMMEFRRFRDHMDKADDTWSLCRSMNTKMPDDAQLLAACTGILGDHARACHHGKDCGLNGLTPEQMVARVRLIAQAPKPKELTADGRVFVVSMTDPSGETWVEVKFKGGIHKLLKEIGAEEGPL